MTVPFTLEQADAIREIVREELQAVGALVRTQAKQAADLLQRWDGTGLEAASRPPTDGHEPQNA